MKKFSAAALLAFAALAGFAQNDLGSKVKVLRRFLEKNHYQPVQWNDTASLMLYNKWMNELDDEKLFFSQKDIEVLQAYKLRLDDEVMGREWNFFDQSVKLFKRNLQKLDSLVKVITAKPADLTKPDNLIWPAPAYAANDRELALRWQQYIKWRILQEMADLAADTSGVIKAAVPQASWETEARAKVRKSEGQFFNNLLQAPAAFKENLEDEYLDAVAWCYDPHTSYMNEKSRKAFETEMSAAEYSVGMDMKENDKGDMAVSYLQPGGSAWRSGQIHAGDVLLKVKIEGKEKEIKDLSEDQLQAILHSNNESGVEVTVRTTSGEIKKVLLAKEKVEHEEAIVKSYLVREKKNIGYINLPGFYTREEDVKSEKEMTLDGCANDVSKEIVKLKKDSIAGMILDLRFNGGGSMWEAMQLAGIFIDIGPVASAKDKEGKVVFLKDPNRGTIYDGPLVILINGASASASEFLSAALQDYNRAVIIGGNSYGKGTAQVVLPMDTSNINTSQQFTDFVKVTTRKFYRIDGNTVQWRGVVPDISLPDIYGDDTYRERANASALQPDKSKAGIYQALPAPPLAALAAKSRGRVAGNHYFTVLTNFFNWVQKTKKERTILLQWPSYVNLYNEGMKMYKEIDGRQPKPILLNITNNNFDAQLLSRSPQRKKEVNEVYISQLRGDAVIAEACQVLLDWDNK